MSFFSFRLFVRSSPPCGSVHDDALDFAFMSSSSDVTRGGGVHCNFFTAAMVPSADMLSAYPLCHCTACSLSLLRKCGGLIRTRKDEWCLLDFFDIMLRCEEIPRQFSWRSEKSCPRLIFWAEARFFDGLLWLNRVQAL